MIADGRKVAFNNEEKGEVRFMAGGTYNNCIDKTLQQSNAEGLANFIVTDLGFLYAKNAVIEGIVTATEGGIGGWKIDESGLYADNNTVGLSSNNADGVRFYAGLEKRLPKGGTVYISMNDFIKTDLGDGWYVWSTSNRDEDGEILGPLTYDLYVSGQTQLNIINAYVVGFYDGSDQVGLRNMDIVYNTKTGKVEILMFETNCTTTTNGLYLVFDIHYKTDDASNANFKVLDNGHIYGDRLNTNYIEADALISESIVSSKFSCESITTNGLTVSGELTCKSIDLDGAKLLKQGGNIIQEAYTKEFNFKIEIANRYFLLYEIDDKSAPATYKFDVQYKLNGKAGTMQVTMPSGSSFESIFVPSKNGDTLTDVAFVKTQTTDIKVEEVIEAIYDDDYIDLNETLAVRSLKIGGEELTETDLENLFQLLYPTKI